MAAARDCLQDMLNSTSDSEACTDRRDSSQIVA